MPVLYRSVFFPMEILSCISIPVEKINFNTQKIKNSFDTLMYKKVYSL